MPNPQTLYPKTREGFQQWLFDQGATNEYTQEALAAWDRRQLEKPLPQFASKLKEGVYNTLYAPQDLTFGALEALGIPTPELYGSRFAGAQDARLFGPAADPYQMPQAKGLTGVFGETIRGGAEAATGVALFGGGGVPVHPVVETLAGMSGGTLAGIAKEKDWGPGAELLSEITGNLLPLSVGSAGKGAWWTARKMGLAPEMESFENVLAQAMEMNTSRRIAPRLRGREAIQNAMLQRGRFGLLETTNYHDLPNNVKIPETATEAARRLTRLTGIDFPTFVMYPELAPYVNYLRQDEGLYTALIADQTGMADQTIQRIQEIAPNIGMDARSVQQMVRRYQFAKESGYQQAIDRLTTKAQTVKQEMASMTAEEAAEWSRKGFYDLYLTEKDEVTRLYEALPEDVKRAEIIDMTPMFETIDWIDNELRDVDVKDLLIRQQDLINRINARRDNPITSMNNVMRGYRSIILEELRRLGKEAPQRSTERRLLSNTPFSSSIDSKSI